MVWARLPDKGHYGIGFVSKKDWRYQVKFSNGTQLYHNLNDPLAMTLDVEPKVESITVGIDVIGCIPKKPLMYPGRVKTILAGGYEIQFDNGQVHKNTIEQLRVLKVPKSEGNCLEFLVLYRLYCDMIWCGMV